MAVSCSVRWLRRSDGFQQRRHDAGIAGTAADMAAQHLAQLLLGRLRIAREIVGERHQDAGRAEAALQGVIVLERLLQLVELAVGAGERFHGLAPRGPRPAWPASGRSAPPRRRSAPCSSRRRRARSRHGCRWRRANGAGNRSAACAARSRPTTLRPLSVRPIRDLLVLVHAAHCLRLLDHDRGEIAQDVAPQLGRGVQVLVAFELRSRASRPRPSPTCRRRARCAAPPAVPAMPPTPSRAVSLSSITAATAMMAKSPCRRATSRKATPRPAIDRKAHRGDQFVRLARGGQHVELEVLRGEHARAALGAQHHLAFEQRRATAEFPSSGRRARSSRRPCPCCGSGNGRRTAAPPPAAAACRRARGQASSLFCVTAAPTSIVSPRSRIASSSGDARDVDQHRRVGQPQIEHRHQRLPAGQHARLVAVLGEQRDRPRRPCRGAT